MVGHGSSHGRALTFVGEEVEGKKVATYANRRRLVAGVLAAGSGSSNPSAPEAFTTLEKVISDTLGGGPGGGWKEVEGCWVLYPPQQQEGQAEIAQPRCLVHFIGGAFVGAAPQLSYRPLLEGIAARGALVVATPYATGFDHLRTVDEVYFKYSRCLKALGPKIQMIPSYGLGHSLGSLMHLLVCSRYVVPRAGNILMSFNNKPATDSIPFLSPLIAPSARALGPILSQLATSPLRSGVEQWVDTLKGWFVGFCFLNCHHNRPYCHHDKVLMLSFLIDCRFVSGCIQTNYSIAGSIDPNLLGCSGWNSGVFPCP